MVTDESTDGTYKYVLQIVFVLQGKSIASTLTVFLVDTTSQLQSMSKSIELLCWNSNVTVFVSDFASYMLKT